MIQLLGMRFGPLDQAALSPMAAAADVQLEAIAERLLVAPTLDDALAVLNDRAS